MITEQVNNKIERAKHEIRELDNFTLLSHFMHYTIKGNPDDDYATSEIFNAMHQEILKRMGTEIAERS